MRRYRLTDCAVFALLLCLLEGACAWARAFFPGELYSFSPALCISLIVLVRWGAVGVAYAAFGGAVFCFLHGASSAQYAVYVTGCPAVAVCLLWKPAVIRSSPLYTTLYCATGWLAVCAGRSAAAFLLGRGFVFFSFITAEALGAIITAIALGVARKQDGLLEPQTEYLKRLEEERKAWNRN